MPNHPPSDGSWRHQLGSPSFPADPQRYHLYTGRFCPFASRVTAVRALKGLEDFLSIDVVKPYPKGDEGWRFPTSNDEYPGATIDSLYHSRFLHEIYFKSDSEYKGKYSVPVLWDKKTEQIVNNESEDIMRMLNTVFNKYLPPDSPQQKLDTYPQHLKEQIDEINGWMMPDLNSGVYKAGFASTQEDYDNNSRIVFQTLDRLEQMLTSSNTIFVLGNVEPTEIDIKLYTTLIRFDTIYQQHFKLMIRSLRHGYPKLHRWMKNLYWNVPGFKETTNFRHIKENYSKSHSGINPKSVTPLGPEPEIESWTENDEQWKRDIEDSMHGAAAEVL